MKAMVCEMCNSNDIQKQDGVYVCQMCGTKYSVEEAKKLLGSVTIDKSEETQKLLILARRARDEQNSTNAEKYYGMVLQEDPDNWEAAFFQVYFQSIQCKIMNIASAAYSVANCVEGVIKLISELKGSKEQDEAISTLIVYSTNIANLFAVSAKNHYDQYNSAQGAFGELRDRIVAVRSIYVNIENGLKKYLPNKTDVIVDLQKLYNSYIRDKRFYLYFGDPTDRIRTSTRLTDEIKAHDPSYEPPVESNPGGCYVATAVYGSYDCPEVWTLRRYRDFELASTWYGRAFIRTY